jgi:O-antigen/teichoic acid export membrane protein
MNKLQAGSRATRDFAWTLCGNVTYSACQWAFVIVLARAGSAEDVGLYALALAISTPLLTFANCQGRNLVASDMHNSHTFSEYVKFRVVSLGLAMASILVIALRTQHTPESAAIICLLGISLAFDWISETSYGLMQKHDGLNIVGQSLMLKGLLCLTLLAGAMYATHSMVWAASALAAGRGLVLALFDIPNAKRTGDWKGEKWRHASFLPQLRAALPLGIISAIGAFNTNIPRYFIEDRMGIRDLGLFSAAASLVGAGSLVMSALGNSSFVGLARATATGDHALYRRLSLRLCLTAAALGIGGVLVSQIAGRQILTRLFRPEYGTASGVLTTLMMAAGITYVISGQGYALTAARVLLPQIPILCCATITTAVFCLWLVPLHGLSGAAEASLFSALVTLGLSSMIVARNRPVEGVPAGPRAPQQISSEAA